MVSCLPSLAERFARSLRSSFPESEIRQAAEIQARPLLPLAQWETRYLGNYFDSPSSAFHRKLIPLLDTFHLVRNQRVNVLGPRGSAKSTHASFALPLRNALHGIEPYTILTSDTGEQAAKYLDAIREEIETNEAIARDYPGVARRGRIWRQSRIVLNNGAMIEAIGTGTKLRGRKKRQYRPSLIIVDDPQNTGHILSALQRERSWEWLTKDVCNAGDPKTNIITLGTALHRDCIVCRLQTTPGWKSYLFRSIVEWPVRMDLWAQWEEILHDYLRGDPEIAARAFYEANQAEMERGAVVLWPEREPLYALMFLRASIGVGAFGTEKQNDPIDPAACEWPSEYFEHGAFWFDRWPDVMPLKALALDPSKGKDSKRGDYSAFVKVARDVAGVYWIEADLRRRDTVQIVADGVEHAKQFEPNAFGVESNQMQELLLGQLLSLGQSAGVHLPLYKIENHLPKPTRIRRLTPILAQKRFRFKRGSAGTQLLVQQLRDFPNGQHDDGPDGLEMGVRTIERIAGERRDAGGIQVWRA